MKIRVTCPACHDTLEIDNEHVGQQAECGSCLQPFTVEDPTARKPEKYTMRRSESDEVDGDEKPAAKSASGINRRSRKQHDDDDWDDRDEDRPRRPRRKWHDEDDPPRKSRAAYLVLAFFFGGLGVHNFYAGRTNIGIAQLMIWLLSWPLMLVFIGCFTIFIPGLWALIDMITVDRDGDGRLMQ